jgi:hypothetical protein
MKRLLFIVFFLFLFLILTPSCKTAEEASTDIPFDARNVGFWSLMGRGSYNSQTNQSTIYFRLVVRNQIASAVSTIKDWKVRLLAGDEVALEITQDNYKTLLGENVFLEVIHPYNQDPNSTTALGRITLHADDSDGKPVPGDIFNGNSPSSIEAFITIENFNGYTYEISNKSIDYTFSRS